MGNTKILLSDTGQIKSKTFLRRLLIVTLPLMFLLLFATTASAAEINLDFNTEQTGASMGALELLFLFALLSLAPSLLIMVTSFTRIVIVFSFMRTAMGLQQTPPNQVIIGIALFLSLFIMQPVIVEINDSALQPYLNEEITQEEALDNVQEPLKRFMLQQTRSVDLNMFLSLSGNEEQLTEVNVDSLLDLGLEIIIPSFITSELSRAFTMGFLLFLPFLVIDMIVSSTLMSMGMVMLPPTMISMPFKLLLFVIVDGWRLLMEMLAGSFY